MRNRWGSPTWKSKQERGLQRSQRDNRTTGEIEGQQDMASAGFFVATSASHWHRTEHPTALKCFYFLSLICV